MYNNRIGWHSHRRTYVMPRHVRFLHLHFVTTARGGNDNTVEDYRSSHTNTPDATEVDLAVVLCGNINRTPPSTSSRSLTLVVVLSPGRCLTLSIPMKSQTKLSLHNVRQFHEGSNKDRLSHTYFSGTLYAYRTRPSHDKSTRVATYYLLSATQTTQPSIFLLHRSI